MQTGSRTRIALCAVQVALAASAAQAIEPGLDVDSYALDKQRIHRPSAVYRSPTTASKNAKIITVVAVGDTGLNAHMAPVRPNGGYKHGDLIPWARATRDIEKEIDGDLNFMNLETIVTANNRIRRENKAFNFRMHPNGARHLIEIGFNLFSTANNHAMDFNAAGARDTLRLLRQMRDDGLLAWPGLGRNRMEAGRPWRMKIKGVKIAASALGIITGRFGHHRAGENRIGQMSYRSKTDFAQTIQRLSQSDAAYKILSVHYGIERDVRATRNEITKLRDIALRDADIDLVLGHHAHVARGIEITNGRVVIYGLGNFLHHGTANMGAMGMCRDYGLMAKLHLITKPNGQLAMRAIEVLPLTMMHRQTRPMKPNKARDRVYVLNYLSSKLDNAGSGARGVRFTPQQDGSGLYCAEGAGDDPGRIGALCTGWQRASAPSSALARRIAGSCGGRSYASSGKSKRRSQRNRRKKRRSKSKSPQSIFSKIFSNSQ